jgi:hypothetical protein
MRASPAVIPSRTRSFISSWSRFFWPPSRGSRRRSVRRSSWSSSHPFREPPRDDSPGNPVSPLPPTCTRRWARTTALRGRTRVDPSGRRGFTARRIPVASSPSPSTPSSTASKRDESSPSGARPPSPAPRPGEPLEVPPPDQGPFHPGRRHLQGVSLRELRGLVEPLLEPGSPGRSPPPSPRPRGWNRGRSMRSRGWGGRRFRPIPVPRTRSPGLRRGLDPPGSTALVPRGHHRPRFPRSPTQGGRFRAGMHPGHRSKKKRGLPAPPLPETPPRGGFSSSE